MNNHKDKTSLIMYKSINPIGIIGYYWKISNPETTFFGYSFEQTAQDAETFFFSII